MMLREFLRFVVRRRTLLSIVFVMGVAGVVYAETRQQGFDLSYVAITGNLNESQRAEVYRYLLAYRTHLHGIGDIKQALDQVPWIEHVDVLRQWPNHITVTVYEEQPIAWWNGDEFLDDSPRRGSAGRDLRTCRGLRAPSVRSWSSISNSPVHWVAPDVPSRAWHLMKGGHGNLRRPVAFT